MTTASLLDISGKLILTGNESPDLHLLNRIAVAYGFKQVTAVPEVIIKQSENPALNGRVKLLDDNLVSQLSERYSSIKDELEKLERKNILYRISPDQNKDLIKDTEKTVKDKKKILGGIYNSKRVRETLAAGGWTTLKRPKPGKNISYENGWFQWKEFLLKSFEEHLTGQRFLGWAYEERSPIMMLDLDWHHNSSPEIFTYELDIVVATINKCYPGSIAQVFKNGIRGVHIFMGFSKGYINRNQIVATLKKNLIAPITGAIESPPRIRLPFCHNYIESVKVINHYDQATGKCWLQDLGDFEPLGDIESLVTQMEGFWNPENHGTKIIRGVAPTSKKLNLQDSTAVQARIEELESYGSGTRHHAWLSYVWKVNYLNHNNSNPMTVKDAFEAVMKKHDGTSKDLSRWSSAKAFEEFNKIWQSASRLTFHTSQRNFSPDKGYLERRIKMPWYLGEKKRVSVIFSAFLFEKGHSRSEVESMVETALIILQDMADYGLWSAIYDRQYIDGKLRSLKGSISYSFSLLNELSKAKGLSYAKETFYALRDCGLIIPIPQIYNNKTKAYSCKDTRFSIHYLLKVDTVFELDTQLDVSAGYARDFFIQEQLRLWKNKKDSIIKFIVASNLATPKKGVFRSRTIDMESFVASGYQEYTRLYSSQGFVATSLLCSLEDKINVDFSQKELMRFGHEQRVSSKIAKPFKIELYSSFNNIIYNSKIYSIEDLIIGLPLGLGMKNPPLESPYMFPKDCNTVGLRYQWCPDPGGGG